MFPVYKSRPVLLPYPPEKVSAGPDVLQSGGARPPSVRTGADDDLEPVEAT